MDMNTERLAEHNLLTVERWWDDSTSTIVKDAGGNVDNWVALAREYWMLNILEGCGYTPRTLARSEAQGWTNQEDVGKNEPVTDPELFRRNCIKMLATFRAAGVRHGDLTGPRDDGQSNIICRDNHPWAVDWQESHKLAESPPQKSPYSDSWLLMRTLSTWADVRGECDTPRVARRWMAILKDLQRDLHWPGGWWWKRVRGEAKQTTFLDLGCYQGDFTALAAAEGMAAQGVDRGGFRSGEDSIAIAQDLWRDFPYGTMAFWRQDFARPGLILESSYTADIVVMFSTWPYIVQDYGQTHAEDVLAACIAGAGRLYFECQIAGDGPGPRFLEDQKAVGAMLVRLGGHAIPLVTIPVTGRDAERVVWLVTTEGGGR